jgi:hypothetical protein
MSLSNCEYCGRNRTDQATECAGCGAPFKDEPISEKGFCGRCGCEKSLEVETKKWVGGGWTFYDPISGKRFTEFTCPNSECYESPKHNHEFKIDSPGGLVV